VEEMPEPTDLPSKEREAQEIAKKTRRTVSMDVSSAAFIPSKRPSSIKKLSE
jgi:hypothetical protein